MLGCRTVSSSRNTAETASEYAAARLAESTRPCSTCCGALRDTVAMTTPCGAAAAASGNAIPWNVASIAVAARDGCSKVPLAMQDRRIAVRSSEPSRSL